MRRPAVGTGSWFGKYVYTYLVVAGISLAIAPSTSSATCWATASS